MMGALILTLVIGICILIGIIIGTCFDNKKGIDITIGLSFIVMFVIAILRVIPKSYSLFSNLDVLPDIKNFVGISNFSFILLIISVVIGFLVLKLVDSFIPNHEYQESKKGNKKYFKHLYHVGLLSSIVLTIYGVLSGMILYVTSIDSFKNGLLLCFGLGILNVPLGILVSLLFKKQVKNIGIILTSSTFIGGILMLLLIKTISEALVGVLLSVLGGMFIYLLISEYGIYIIKTKDRKDIYVGMVIGILLGGISLLLG